MTRGNQREVDRIRSSRRNDKTKQNSTVKDASKNLNVVCKLCRHSFMCTVNQSILKEHHEKKHSKNAYEDCFS
ncbi:hypothetical protein PFNF135_02183 [Plasmodium falciparum NF135/5.C10]|uniref:Uncharacterized protein n=2 Tax=Plasmodium falciparum TaxID=5833 RepID=A0A0L7M3S7_PLAF4|nr:hypothetical protein PFNF135_02183 [Plasmodium falciparum NF135/5.C10]KOB87501.1 hypothetical protein PFDG_03538 [Plasmodium falciparum Dd2]